MLYSVLYNLIGGQLLFGLYRIQYKCIGVELYSCSTYHKGNARARSKEEHTVVSTLCCICIISMFNAPSRRRWYKGRHYISRITNVPH